MTRSKMYIAEKNQLDKPITQTPIPRALSLRQAADLYRRDIDMRNLVRVAQWILAMMLPSTGRHRAPTVGEPITGRHRALKVPQTIAAYWLRVTITTPEPSSYTADNGPLASPYAPLLLRYLIEQENRRQRWKHAETRRCRRALFITSAQVDMGPLWAGAGAR
jgi:hypothetical protein